MLDFAQVEKLTFNASRRPPTEQERNVLLFGIVGTFSFPRFHKSWDQSEQVVLQKQRRHRSRAETGETILKRLAQFAAVKY